MKNQKPLWKTLWENQFKIIVPLNPAIPSLGVHWKEIHEQILDIQSCFHPSILEGTMTLHYGVVIVNIKHKLTASRMSEETPLSMSVRHFLDCINWWVRHPLSVVDTYGLGRKGKAWLSTRLPLLPYCRHSVLSFPMLLLPQLPTMMDWLLKLWAKAEPSFPRFFWRGLCPGWAHLLILPMQHTWQVLRWELAVSSLLHHISHLVRFSFFPWSGP